jgi:multidrug resistance efflux pump
MKAWSLKSRAGGAFRFGRLRLHVVPFLVWLAVVGCVIVLFRHRTQRFEVLGLAQGRVHQVAATSTGRLREIRVQLFDEVAKGIEVAVIDTVLDNENLQTQLNTALAEVQHLKAQFAPAREQLVAEATSLDTGRVAALRRFSVDAEAARMRVLELKAQIEADRIAVEAMEVERKAFLVQRLSDQNEVVYYELQAMKVRRETLGNQIEENERLLEQAEQDLGQAEQRRDEFAQRQPQHPPIDTALEVIQKAVAVQEQRIEELLARRQPLVLTSPIDGVVSLVQHKAGEAILAGEPILSIAEVKPSEIVAYAGEDQLGRVREGLVVELVKDGEPAQVANSQVVYLGPGMELMPQRLWRNPNVPQWGQPVLIKIPPGMELLPGEPVGIRGL